MDRRGRPLPSQGSWDEVPGKKTLLFARWLLNYRSAMEAIVIMNMSKPLMEGSCIMNESSKGVLMIVDDEPLKRVTLQIECTEAGYTVHEFSDAASALQMLNQTPVDVVITDLRMPGMDGLQFLERIKAQSPQTHVILMTAYGSIDSAVEAIKRGAYDYLAKPFRTGLLLEKVDRLLACRRVSAGAQSPELEKLGNMVARSASARRLFERIRTVADNERAILIQGESGTGKKRVAETIHQLSRRKERPFVPFACNISRPDLIAEELCGVPDSKAPSRGGVFARANGGTLLLEHVDALPLDLQVKLLQLVEENSGAHSGKPGRGPLDVRVLCTTRNDLRHLVDEGRFREDLYFLLCAVSLTIPPLRERREDIPVLADLFLKDDAAQAAGKKRPVKIHPHALDALVEYHWPANVRELQHVIHRAVAFAEGDEIQPKDIMLSPETQAAAANQVVIPEIAGLTETIAGVERTLIHAALRRASGNQAKAAQYLRIPRTTLRDKMAKYGMFEQPEQTEPTEPVESSG